MKYLLFVLLMIVMTACTTSSNYTNSASSRGTALKAVVLDVANTETEFATYKVKRLDNSTVAFFKSVYSYTPGDTIYVKLSVITY